MTKYIQHPRKGFTLIELLTVIAIIGILAAIIIPTVGKVRETAKRSVASSNLRQVGQASLIYATDNGDFLPKTQNAVGSTASATDTKLDGIMFQLAYGGGLNDASIWFTGSDDSTGVSTVMDSSKTGLINTFTPSKTSYNYMAGLNATDPSTTPIAWTRKLKTDGSWDNAGPWKTDGGHIVFLGGNVSWYKKIDANNTLISRDGTTTSNISNTTPRTDTSVAIREP